MVKYVGRVASVFASAMERIASRLLRILEAVSPGLRRARAMREAAQRLVARLPVVGAHLEDNGWMLEINRDGEALEVLLRGTYGERIGGGIAEDLRGAFVTFVLCGDVKIGPCEMDSVLEIRTLSGQLIGHVPRTRLAEVASSGALTPRERVG